jgi:transcription elongation GreA/GreB family factor
VEIEEFDGSIALGTRALVTLADGSEEWVRPVHPREAFLDDERISVTSPVGSALIGAKPGDVVSVNAPTGLWKCSVRSTEFVKVKEAT